MNPRATSRTDPDFLTERNLIPADSSLVLARSGSPSCNAIEGSDPAPVPEASPMLSEPDEASSRARAVVLLTSVQSEPTDAAGVLLGKQQCTRCFMAVVVGAVVRRTGFVRSGEPLSFRHEQPRLARSVFSRNSGGLPGRTSPRFRWT